MKKIFLLLFSALLCLQAAAQVKTDSLWAIWNNKQKPDTTRITAMLGLGAYYINSHPDSTLMAGQNAYDLANQISKQAAMGSARNLQGLALMYMGRFEESIQYYNEAISLLEKTSHKKILANVLMNASHAYESLGEIDESVRSLERSIAIGEEIRDTAILVKTLNSVAVIYFDRDPPKAKSSLQEALAILEHFKDEQSELGVKVNLGLIEQTIGNHAVAVDYFSSSMKLAIKLNNQRVLVSIYNLLGNSSMDLKEFDQAKSYFNKSLELAESTKYLQGKSTALGSLGNLMSQLGEHRSALNYSFQSLEISEQIQDVNAIATQLLNIGSEYASLGRLDSAQFYLEKALVLQKDLHDDHSLSIIYNLLGTTFFESGNKAKGIAYVKQGLKIAQDLHIMPRIQEAAENLYLFYKETGDYKQALEMLELNHAMLDSIAREENQRAIIRQEYQSSYEKQKALDDKENEKKLAVEAERRRNQQRLTWAIGIGLLLISALALVILNRLRVTRQQKAIIEEQKKKVEQSEKYKEQFLANMSHELRTPMHAISGMLGILQRNKHLPEQEPYLQAMQTSAENLVVILNDVLDLSKIEAGKLDIEQVPVDPGAVLGHVMQVMQYKAEEKGLVLRHTVADDVPPLVTGDPTRLNQMLLNLVGNAIKFTQKGSVSVTLSRQTDKLRFAVSDTGVGIPKEKLESIFQAFEQAEQSTARHYGGTGLGLAITRQLATLQGGRIWVESIPGQGSTFYLELPLVAVAAGGVSSDLISQERLKTMAAALKGIQILLAEDNPFNQMIAQDDLAYYIGDVKVDVAQNGVEALQKFREKKYDLILMDVQMPEMNGFEASSAIRTLEREQGLTTGIPIVAMTASLLKTEIDHCYNSGMNNYIPKPYKPEELIGVMYRELKERI